ncbi:MAG TPA: stage V sporulation protein AE [Ruminococcus sp.]|nr:stage V sporulation protein AE [Ruminococcus sp.]
MLWDMIKAFIVGGALCAAGQVLIDRTKLTPARILTGYVVAGVVLSALGIYGPLADFAGAGASVPLTGFGHLLAEGVRRAVSERGLLGLFTGGLTASSGGIEAALLAGLAASLIFPQKDKA